MMKAKTRPRINWRKRESEAFADLPGFIPGTPAYEAFDKLGLLHEPRDEPTFRPVDEAKHQSAFQRLEQANRSIINGYVRRNTNRQRDKHASAAIALLIRIHGETVVATKPLTGKTLERYADDLEDAAIPTGSADGWLPVNVRSLIRRWREKRAKR